MDIQIKNYSFNKTSKTVTFTDYVSIRLDSIRIITNVESNVVIYNFAQQGLGGSVLNNILTLDYDTSLMNDNDKLQIVYNDDSIKATKENQDAILINQGSILSKSESIVANTGGILVAQETLNNLVETLNELVSRLNVLTGMANSGAPALRVIPIASVSTAVTGSVTATVSSTVVSSLTNFGTGIPAKEMADDINNYTATIANINNVTT